MYVLNKSMADIKKNHAVKFNQYGGVEVLNVQETLIPALGPTQVLVRVKAAGINIGEAMIREGAFARQWPTTFPSGQGSDFAGIIETTGHEVKDLAAGDEVIGFTNDRGSQAEFVAVEAHQLIHRPPGVPWEQAGALFVAGTTAYAAVKAVNLKPRDIVVISGAAGGVGSIAVQLAGLAGAKVIGLASEANHQWLIEHNAIPVSYGEATGPGEALAARIRNASGGHVDAFIDTVGEGYVELALELGVKADRIDTIMDFEAAKKYGVKTAGNSEGGKPEVLTELAGLIDAGKLQIPIAAVYRLTDVRDAYRELAKHHTHGKVVLVP
jgi:NADPH:quinone reductase-like Zn-dependent oxidoreductase